MRNRRDTILLLGGAVLAAVPATAPAAEDAGAWRDIRPWLFNERPIEDGSGLFTLEAPKRAHDAAIVPIGIRALQSLPPERAIRSIHLIIDDNPAPLAAVFKLGPALGSVDLSARVRVNLASDDVRQKIALLTQSGADGMPLTYGR